MITLRVQYILLFVVLSGIFLLPFLTYAQEAERVVRQQIGEDTLPPTQPAFINATAISPTQIDVSWGTSTDEYLFGGYRLFRDAVQIATTTQSSYSDTGLIASTTYSYTVNAFDWQFITSTTTGPVATTTLEAPPVPVDIGSENVGTFLQPRMTEFLLETTTDTGIFNWKTNIYTSYLIRWGLSESYELGFIQSGVFQREHLTFVEGLEPETTYQFELVGINQQGRQYVLNSGSFKTKALPDLTAPPNVTGLTAVVDGSGAFLSWNNPGSPDFSKVRVVRNHLFYPDSPTDGFIVYEGRGDSALDATAFRDHDRAYYTVFSYDTVGNISSGAIVLATRAGVDDDIPGNLTRDSRAGEDVIVDVDGRVINLSFSDVEFWQNDLLLQQGEDNVTVRNDASFVVRIPESKLPTYLNTLTLRLSDRSDTANAYILRRNNEQGTYEAQIEALPEGFYQARFSLFNFAQEQYVVFTGEVISASENNELSGEERTLIGQLASEDGLPIAEGVSLLVVLLLLWFFFILRRSSEDN